MHMLKLFLGTALIYSPFGVINALLCFIFSQWLLKYRRHAIVKLAMLLISCAAIAGVIYGSLRFGGVILYPEDNFMSWNWFDASYRDDGFGFVYPCGTALIGMAAAVLPEWKACTKLQTTEGGAQG